MTCENKKCTATLIRYENPDFSHPWDNPASTFICTRDSDGKQTFSHSVYESAEAEFRKMIGEMNQAEAVKDSCENGCECQIEYEKRGASRRVKLPAIQVQIKISATGATPTTVTYTVVTTVEKIKILGIGECKKKPG